MLVARHIDDDRDAAALRVLANGAAHSCEQWEHKITSASNLDVHETPSLTDDFEEMSTHDDEAPDTNLVARSRGRRDMMTMHDEYRRAFEVVVTRLNEMDDKLMRALG